ncbi:MAG: RNA polymerase factor sigma-54 [Eubacterium sp.]|nr:RNA polymerase factor sigma-54 [Eubacterium sp.]
MNLSMELVQKQTLSQRMLQSTDILQMNSIELESYIENLALDNPVIDIDFDKGTTSEPINDEIQRKLQWLESSDYQNRVYYKQEREADYSQEQWHRTYETEEILSEYLFSQLLTTEFSDFDQKALKYMILLLDSKGYLTEDLSDIASQLHISYEHAERILQTIQSLEPIGVGARNLSECLLLQLYRKPAYSPVTEEIIKHYLSDVGKNHLSIIARKLGVSLDEVTEACNEIKQMNPKPGSSFSNREQMRYIVPDIVVVKLEEKFEILVNESSYPTFNINAYYKSLMEDAPDKEVYDYLKKKVSQAEWVQNCITQRISTLSRVAHAIVEEQHDFFLYGPLSKKPLRLVDLADRLDLHESTISRAMKGKYLQCTWGLFPLNFFLTASLNKQFTATGESQTPDKAKEAIKSIVSQENKNKPYSDNKISEQLEILGIHISRRTVTKYRLELGIPDKSGRKSLSAL